MPRSTSNTIAGCPVQSQWLQSRGTALTPPRAGTPAARAPPRAARPPRRPPAGTRSRRPSPTAVEGREQSRTKILRVGAVAPAAGGPGPAPPPPGRRRVRAAPLCWNSDRRPFNLGLNAIIEPTDRHRGPPLTSLPRLDLTSDALTAVRAGRIETSAGEGGVEGGSPFPSRLTEKFVQTELCDLGPAALSEEESPRASSEGAAQRNAARATRGGGAEPLHLSPPNHTPSSSRSLQSQAQSPRWVVAGGRRAGGKPGRRGARTAPRRRWKGTSSRTSSCGCAPLPAHPAPPAVPPSRESSIAAGTGPQQRRELGGQQQRQGGVAGGGGGPQRASRCGGVPPGPAQPPFPRSGPTNEPGAPTGVHALERRKAGGRPALPGLPRPGAASPRQK